ncbi:overexpressed in colon carcinoma 1 protein [Rhinoderma darwinii]|uniref:overexpressed in colon carcinoma 1 protein n=1 Tax=Rhinoderma darwinii TaxID=43563 RepID=UPI003F66615E
MGCCSSSSAEGCMGPRKDTSDDTTSQDDKHRNYGGVYIGLPTDTSTASEDAKGAQASCQLKALNTAPGSPLPKNDC